MQRTIPLIDRDPNSWPAILRAMESEDQARKNKPKREPVVIAAEKAYRASAQCKLDKLVRKRSLYRRRLTLALAGLEATQGEIESLLSGLVERDRMAAALPVEERKIR